MKMKFRFIKMYDVYDFNVGHIHKENNYDELLLKMDKFWNAGIQLYFPEKMRHNTILFTKKEYFDNVLRLIFDDFKTCFDVNIIDLSLQDCVVVMTFDLINSILRNRHRDNNNIDNMKSIRYYDSAFIKSHFTLKFFPNYENDISLMNRITRREVIINNRRSRQIRDL